MSRFSQAEAQEHGLDSLRQSGAIVAPAAGSSTIRFVVLALLAALLIFPALRREGLAGYDDAVYAHEGREMVRTGDWWDIRFNGHLNFEYPPLYMWLEASSFKVLGIKDAAAKLPTAILGLGTILLVYFLTLELTGQPWLSLFAMLVLASTQFFLKNCTHAMTDVPFTFFFTLALLFYAKSRKSDVWLLLMGLPVGFAMLTRSIIGVLILGIVACHLIVTRRYKSLRSPWLMLGILLAFAMPAIWYISQCQLHGTSSILAHFRFVTSKIHVGEETGKWPTILNYPVALLKYYWPWLPFMIAGIVFEVKATRRRDETASFLLIWVLLVLVPFSIVQTRYPRYIMPVFPAFSILSAIALDRWLPATRRALFFKFACGVGCLAIVLANLFPPKARAEDMKTLVPIADANTTPQQRPAIYSYQDGRSDYFDQFLWYSDRYAYQALSLKDLAAQVSNGTVVLVDKKSYPKLLTLLPPATAQNLQRLGESENFVCVRKSW